MAHKNKEKKNFLGYEKSVMETSHVRSKYFLGISLIFLALALYLNSQELSIITLLGGLAVGTVFVGFINLVIYKVVIQFDPESKTNRFDMFGITYLVISLIALVSIIFS